MRAVFTQRSCDVGDSQDAHRSIQCSGRETTMIAAHVIALVSSARNRRQVLERGSPPKDALRVKTVHLGALPLQPGKRTWLVPHGIGNADASQVVHPRRGPDE